MKLTDKSLEQFEKWYIETECTDIEPKEYSFELNIFWNVLTDSMQYGVLVDFFDSVGIEIDITPQYGYFEYMVSISDNEFQHGKTKTKSRPQAREQAITKAVEILNERK